MEWSESIKQFTIQFKENKLFCFHLWLNVIVDWRTEWNGWNEGATFFRSQPTQIQINFHFSSFLRSELIDLLCWLSLACRASAWFVIPAHSLAARLSLISSINWFHSKQADAAFIPLHSLLNFIVELELLVEFVDVRSCGGAIGGATAHNRAAIHSINLNQLIQLNPCSALLINSLLSLLNRRSQPPQGLQLFLSFFELPIRKSSSLRKKESWLAGRVKSHLIHKINSSFNWFHAVHQ